MGSKRVDLVSVKDAPAGTVSAAADLFKDCSVIDVEELVELLTKNVNSEDIGKDISSAFVAKVTRIHPIPKIRSTVGDFQLRKVLLVEATSTSGKTLAAEVVLFGPYASNIDHVVTLGDVICVHQPHITCSRPEREPPKNLITAMANFVVLVGDDQQRPLSRITLFKNVKFISRAVEELDPDQPSTSAAARAADVATPPRRRSPAKTVATDVERRTPRKATTAASADRAPPALPATSAAPAPSVVSPPAATVTPAATTVPPSSTGKQATTASGISLAPPTSNAVSKGYTYTNLINCDDISKTKKYNVWAVITKVSRQPSLTKTSKLMAQVYIQDPEYQGSYGHADYQFSILSNKLEDFPPLSVGAVIRIHHMQVQEWNGSKNGRVFDARCIAVIPGKVGDPIVPKFTSLASQFEFTEADEEKVKELRQWWDLFQRQRDQETELNVPEKEIWEVNGACVFDLRCKVLRVFRTKMQDKNFVVLRVTDGTNSLAYAVTCAEDNEEEDIHFRCTREGQPHIDIFVSEGGDWLEQLKEDSFVLFKQVECVAEKLVDSESVERLSAFRFHLGDGFSFMALPTDHSTIRKVRRNIERGGPAEPPNEASLLQLLEEFKVTPDPLTQSTSSM